MAKRATKKVNSNELDGKEFFAAIAQIAFRSWLHAKTSDRVGEWEDIWQDFDEAMQQEEYE